jgi:hypothetical protein
MAVLKAGSVNREKYSSLCYLSFRNFAQSKSFRERSTTLESKLTSLLLKRNFRFSRTGYPYRRLRHKAAPSIKQKLGNAKVWIFYVHIVATFGKIRHRAEINGKAGIKRDEGSLQDALIRTCKCLFQKMALILPIGSVFLFMRNHATIYCDKLKPFCSAENANYFQCGSLRS